jgi:hypothetical protein
MTTATRILQSLLIATLLAAGSSYAADNTVQVAMEDGRTVATFKLGDSNCVLRDERIRCAPIKK